MSVAHDEKVLKTYLERATSVSKDAPVVISKFEHNAKEIEVDAVAHRHFESFREALEAGVRIGVGTDFIEDASHGQNARELELMVRHGATPMQALVAATRTSAHVCRIGDRVGTLEVGKVADLLVVDGDPLDDIAILQESSRLLLVMKEGRAYVDRLEVAS